MRSASSAPPCPASTGVRRRIDVAARPALSVRLGDYLELAKPRVSLMVLVAVSVGYSVSGAGSWALLPLLHALAGVGLVAAGSCALNQWIERRSDARMRRTAGRPLPSGRLLSAEVLVLGTAAGLGGAAWLAWQVNLLTAGLSLLTLGLYTLVYTPLKRYTSLCTAVGAVPGAMPPVLGWTAAGGQLDSGAFSLFAILFLWQFPHFLAIAWLYREDYARAGLRMLPGVQPSPRITGLMAVCYALVLVPASLLPAQFAVAGQFYMVVAAVLGLVYLAGSVRFAIDERSETARGLIRISLVYLPVLLLALTWDHIQLLK